MKKLFLFKMDALIKIHFLIILYLTQDNGTKESDFCSLLRATVQITKRDATNSFP